MARMTKEELLEKLFHDDYEHLKGKKLRMTRVRVPGKEVCLAHVITPSDTSIYHNLALHIGVHEGEDHSGESIGLTLGISCSGRRRSCEKRSCGDWIYGSVLWITDPHRRTG